MSRLLLALALLAALAAPAQAAITLVDHACGLGTTSNNATTADINTTGANLIVMGVVSYSAGDGGTSYTVSDNKGNSWTISSNSSASSQARVRMGFTIPTSVGSSHHFTASMVNAGSYYMVVCVSAWSAASSVSVFDQENGATAGSGTSLATGSITPTENNEVVVTMVGPTTANTLTINSGYTATDVVNYLPGTHLAGGMAYLVQTSAGATNPTWSWTSSSDVAARIASFKATPVAGGFALPIIVGRPEARR